MISVLTCAAAFAALAIFFQLTRLGRQFRGAAENPLLAAQRQVNINLILAVAWGVAVFSAALAGVLFGSRSMLSPQSTIIGLSGLTAALVGGLDSLRGAAIGGSPRGRGYLSHRASDQPDARRNRAVPYSSGRDELAAVGIVRHGRRDSTAFEDAPCGKASPYLLVSYAQTNRILAGALPASSGRHSCRGDFVHAGRRPAIIFYT